MFTQRAALLGFVAFCFYLIAVVNSLPTFYFALTWLAVGMLGASLGIALLSLVGVKFEFEIARSRASASLENLEGEGPQVRISISNSGTLNKTGILLVLEMVDAQKRACPQRFVIEAVPSGAVIEAVLPLSDLKRGRYRLEAARLTGSDVLGLFRMRKRFFLTEGAAQEVIVGPPVLRGEGFEMRSGGGARNGSRRTVATGMGDEMRGTRPYAPGDDLRHVHWKSSARAGELVVKEFEQTGRSTALVVWDGAANTSWGEGAWQSDEWSLILCASLCHSILGSGTPCDFARLDETPLAVGARGLISDQLPVGFIDALASACANRRSSLETALGEVSRLVARPYATVWLVTASLNADVLSHARFWRGRGARVQVLVVDGAALGERSDRRFRARGAARRGATLRAARRDARPTQGEGEDALVVSDDGYASQLGQLRAAGFEAVRVAPTRDEPHQTLRAALRQLQFSRSTPRGATAIAESEISAATATAR